MILDEFVEVNWNNSNKKHYLNKGYVFTKNSDKLQVKIDDLSYGSHTVVNVVCDICGKKKKMLYKSYILNINRGENYCCSEACSMGKKRKTNLARFGVEYPQKTDNVKNKRKETNIKKYGYKSPIENKDVKKKFKETNIKKYGCEYPMQNLDFVKKRAEANIVKYGCVCSLQNKIVESKSKKTNIKKYGVEFPMQNKVIAKKGMLTKMERYGVMWCKLVPNYNGNSILYFDLFSEKLNVSIQHALNNGEKRFGKYFIDGYIEEYNICVEWDEKGHNGKKQKEKDLKREQFLKENFDCKIIRICEKEFLNDIDNQLVLIVEKINNVINESKVFFN